MALNIKNDSRTALLVFGSIIFSLAWLSATLLFSPSSVLTIFSFSFLFVVVTLCSIFIARDSARPARKMVKILSELSESDLRDRRYVEDVSDIYGRLELELNTLLDRMEDSMARQRQFVGAVSHDIRTPLTIMKGDIEVALMRERPRQEYRDILLSNLEEVERIHRLVEDLVTLARADYGEIGLNLKAVALGALVAETREGFIEMSRRKDIIVESYIEGDIHMEGDEARLRQLIHNLLDNAVHYTATGGRVEITLVTDTEREEVQLRVKDTGIGISRQDLPHIFEPFYRGHPSKRTSHDGYGLGLAICDHIVKAHNGKISVESRVGPDSGTTFSVLIPLRSRPT
jgi:signal transduction histidine kinase